MTVPDATLVSMTTTHEELARRHRAWTEDWERQRAELRLVEARIDERRTILEGRPADLTLRELERHRSTILEDKLPALIREADELDELGERLAARQRHPAGKRRGRR